MQPIPKIIKGVVVLSKGKKKIKSLIAIALFASSIASFTQNINITKAYAEVNAEESVVEDTRLTYEEEQGAILHAWDWSFKNIIANLDEISKAGYTAVQVSPIQGNIDVDGNMMSNEKWWVLYQPINFKIGNKQLGTEEEFKELCSAAHEKGIKIIVDTIVNHTGNTLDNADTPSKYVDKEITALGKDAWHELVPVEDWNSRYCVTQQDVGLPDLNTENKDIQAMARKFLETCLEAGADGFRFDTTKHVALPTDDDVDGKKVASDFWPTVLEGLKKKDGNTPYIYGEVLQGGADNFNEYSKYINVTSSNYGANVRSAIRNSNFDGLEYASDGVSPSRLISWVESHDTYANDSEESTDMTDEQLRNGWALIAARSEANPLFFNRPAGRGKLDNSIGDQGDDNWRNGDVVAVNKFRKAMLNTDEKLVNISKKTIMIQRGTSENAEVKGLVIVNLDSDKEITDLDVNLEDGNYNNCGITDADFTVTDGKMSGTIPKGITVLYKDGEKEKDVIIPEVSIDKENQSFDGDELTLTLKAENSDNATYSINGGEKIAYSDGDKITIGKDSKPSEKIDVVLEAENEDGTRHAKETYFYMKRAQGESATVYFEKPDDWKGPIYVHASNEVKEENADYPGEKMTKIGENLYKYEISNWTDSTVVFNNWYNGNKTGDLSLKYNGTMIYKDGNWTETEKLPEEVVEDDNEGEGTSKVYVEIPDSWKDENGDPYTDIYVYMYGVYELKPWPGVPMTKVEGKDNLYTYTLPEGLEGSMVLFNAQGGKVQVPANTGFKAPANSTMIYKDGEWKEYLNGTSKAYFRKPADWGEPKIYVYKDNGDKIAEWPGVSMNKVDGTDTLYSYTLPENYGDSKIIFTDGTNQTTSLSLPSESAMIYDNGNLREFKTSDLEEPEVPSDEEGYTKVYFKNTLGWENVYVYAYNNDPFSEVKKWPGVAAKDEGNGLYSYSLPSGYENAVVIFTNNQGAQTENLQTVGGHSMIYDPESKSLTDMSKVYFKNKDNWEKVKIHYWKDGGDSTTWPGMSMVDYGNGLYGYTMPDGFENANIIFNNNNNGIQSETVKVTSGQTMILDENGEWREFKDSDIQVSSPDENNNVSSVTISGTTKVGNILTAKAFDKDKNEITSGLKYQWYRGTEADGEFEEIADAVASEYKLTSDDKSKYIKVTVEDAESNKVSVVTDAKVTTSSSSSHHHDSDDKDDDKDDTNVDKNMTDGWHKGEDGKWYFVEDGKKVTGWKLIKGLWYLLDEQGNMQHGWSYNMGVWYFLNNDGSMQTGWRLIDNNWYLFSQSGAMQTGWQMYQNRWYLMDSHGVMSRGWQRCGDKWFYLNVRGEMETGWQYLDNKWYFLNDDGSMATGWHRDNGSWYYLYENGEMAVNTVINGYKLNAHGAWI